MTECQPIPDGASLSKQGAHVRPEGVERVETTTPNGLGHGASDEPGVGVRLALYVSLPLTLH